MPRQVIGIWGREDHGLLVLHIAYDFDYNYLITDLLSYASLVQRGLPTAIDKMHVFVQGGISPPE